jgi:hypothetical protein
MTDNQRGFWDDEIKRDNDAKRLARTNDPDTSHEAAKNTVESGQFESQCRQTLALVKQFPDCSATELGRMVMFKPRRRLRVLERQGLVKVVGKRKCRKTGIKVMIWRAVEP